MFRLKRILYLVENFKFLRERDKKIEILEILILVKVMFAFSWER